MRRFKRIGQISLAATSFFLGGARVNASIPKESKHQAPAIMNREVLPERITIKPKLLVIPKEHFKLYTILASKYKNSSSVIYVGNQRIRISLEFAAQRAFLRLLKTHPAQIQRYFRNQHNLETTICERAAEMQVTGIMSFNEALEKIDHVIELRQKEEEITNPLIDDIADKIEADHKK